MTVAFVTTVAPPPIIPVIEGFMQTRSGDGRGLRTIADRLRDELGAIVPYLQWDDDVVGTIRSLKTGHPDSKVFGLGYSYGGGKLIRAGWQLDADEEIDLDGGVLLDEVPRWASGQFQNLAQVLFPFLSKDSARVTVPDNIRRATLLYQRNDAPWGVLLKERADGSVVNVNISSCGAGHVQLPGTPAIQDMIVEQFRIYAGVAAGAAS